MKHLFCYVKVWEHGNVQDFLVYDKGQKANILVYDKDAQWRRLVMVSFQPIFHG